MDVRPDARVHQHQRGLSELSLVCQGANARERARRAEEALMVNQKTFSPICPAFEISSKRRKGYPSETRIKRGLRFVHGDKELVEKLGRKDPCPCGSGQRFPQLLP